MAVWNVLQEYMSPRLNYQKCRILYRSHTSDEPILPFLGTYLTDLVYIDELYSTERPKGHIQFLKMRKFVKIFESIEECRRSRSYPFPINHAVRSYLFATTPIFSDEQLYRVSHICEPVKELPIQLIEKLLEVYLRSEEIPLSRIVSDRDCKIKIRPLSRPRCHPIRLLRDSIKSLSV
jgi:hypothetical protein